MYIRLRMKRFVLFLLVIGAAVCVATDVPKTIGTYDQCAQDTTINNLVVGIKMSYDSLAKVSHKEKIIVGIKNGEDYKYYKLDFDDYRNAEMVVCAGYDCQLIFANKGFITKRININTSGAPASFWNGGFYMEMDIAMIERPENFDDTITEIPLGIAHYNAQQESFVFDETYTAERKMALDEAVAKARTVVPSKK